MFSRGRPCLRRRGLSAVLDTVAAGPEEPLLFLYPRWFTSALRQQRSITSIKTATNTRRSPGSDRLLSRSSCPPRRLSFGSSSRRWISANTAVGSDVVRPADTSPQHGISTASRGNSRSKQAKGQGSGGGSSNATDSSEKTAHLEESSSSRELQKDNTPRTNEKGKRPFNIFSDIHTIARTLMAASNGPSQDEALGTMQSLSVRDRRKLRYRLYLTKQTQQRDTKNRWGRWTQVGDLLERMQRDTRVWAKKGTRQKELLIPEETVALITGITDMAMKENIWYVPIHNGCRVHVLHPRESEGQYRKVILSGSKRVVELVGDRIMRARSLQENGDPLVDIRKPTVPVFPSIEALRRKNLPVPLVRGVWDFYQASGKPAQLDLLLPLSEKLSSIREFAEHVEELTRSVSSSSNGHSQGSHEERVASALVAIFQNDANRNLFSTAPLNRAISFLFEHEFLNDARTVFTKAEHVATVDTFNILLKSAAKRQDIQVFRSFLFAMSRTHIRPDPYTWLAFLDCLVSPNAKAGLATYMLEKGYLSEAGAMRTALQLTIQDTFLAHLRSGQSVDAFFSMIIDTYGANWFPPSLINQMLSVTVRLKDYSAMERLLEICKQQGFALDGSTINQILLMFRSDISSAIRYLFLYVDRLETQLKGDAWERLFLIAFKGRNYNICRVLWRYACMNGAATYKMKQSVLTSLTRNIPRKKGTDVDDLWRTSAGNIIVGIDFHMSECPIKDSILDDVPNEFLENPISYLASGFKPKGEDRERQLRLASALVQRDIEIGPSYRPTEPFAIMLEAADVMDREGNGIPRPMQWLVQNSIRVPVRKTESLSELV